MIHPCRLLLPFLIFTVCSISRGEAHGLGYRIDDKTVTPVVSFSYSDGHPASYAEVTVWSPIDKKIEFQNGRTDKNGRFAFIPDASGVWRIVLTDGRGHASSAEYSFNTAGKEKTTHIENMPPGKQSRLMSILLGTSLIFNIAAVIRYRKLRLSSASASPVP